MDQKPGHPLPNITEPGPFMDLVGKRFYPPEPEVPEHVAFNPMGRPVRNFAQFNKR